VSAVTVIDLKFDTSTAGRAPLGDIASSLVSVDELLRDLATIAAYPSGAEYREIQVAAMTMRNPMKVTLSLLAIPDRSVKAFQEICRQIIISRERRVALNRSAIDAALAICAPEAEHARLTAHEAERIHTHVARLHAAEVPLREIVIKPASSAALE
jgi:hypothetical protein